MIIKKKERKKISLDPVENNINELIKIAQSGSTYNKVRIAENPNTPPKVLAILVDSDDKIVYNAVASNPNINIDVFNRILKGDLKVSSSFYRNFVKNTSFKKEWIYDYITFIGKSGNASGVILSLLEDERFSNNTAEWLKLYDKIKETINMKNLQIHIFWLNFFKFPKKNYDEKIVLSILDDFGYVISKFNNGTFDFIVGTPMETPKILLKIFEITQDINYAPQEIKDIFVF